MLKKWFENKTRYLWLVLALLTLTLVYLAHAPLVLKNACLIDAAGNREMIAMPLLRDTPQGAEYIISGTVYYRRWLNCSVAHLIPDDHLIAIRINRREASLAQVAPEALRDYTNGFHYNFAGYLRDGANHIEIRIKNTGGPSGLNIRPSYRDWRMAAGCLLLALLTLGLVYLLASGTAIDPVLALIFTGGFLLRALYFLNTSFDVRTHDVGGHMQYIEYLLANRTIPAIHYGWQTYHPPLYYIVAAFLYQLLRWAGITQTAQIWRGIQFLSVLLYMGFLGAALQVVKGAVGKMPYLVPKPGEFHAPGPGRENDAGVLRVLDPDASDNPDVKPRTAFLRPGDPRRAIVYLTFALLVFWPSGIIHSVRIGNDTLFYLFYLLGLTYLCKWWDDDSRRSLYGSFIFITLAFVTKANALVLYLVFGVVYLLKIGKAEDKRRYLVTTAALGAIFMVGFGITFGRMVVLRLNNNSNDHFVVANAASLRGVAVGNTPKNYLWFDLPSFVTEPYVNPFEDRGGRQFFWNYLFKTALVGEFSYNNPINRILTILLSVAFVLMLLYTVISLIVFSSYLRGQLVLVLNAVILLGAAIAFRISIPAACSNDFRYILPILVSFAVFFAGALWCYRQRRRNWLERIGYGLAVFFMATSTAFFLVLALG
jgi:hypothetical protein